MHFVQVIDSLDIGGAQKMQIMFAKEILRKHDIKLTILVLRQAKTTIIQAELQSLGIHLVTYPHKKLVSPRCVRYISNFLRQEGCDVVHTHLLYSNILGGLAGWLAGIPVVATIHNSIVDSGGSNPKLFKLETWVLRHLVQRVIGCGYATAKSHQSRLGNKHIESIPNAIQVNPQFSIAERAAIRAEILDDPTRPLLIAVGRLMPQKGYKDLLNAFAKIRLKHPKAALVIAGDGPLFAELTAQIKSLGLEGQAMLLGFRQDIPRLLMASDIFVNSSHWEGLPIAMLEAMAAGLPVVATNVSDVPHVVVEGTGLIVPSKAPDKLAQAICSFLDNPTCLKAAGEAAKIHILNHHNPTKWAERILAVYQQSYLKTKM